MVHFSDSMLLYCVSVKHLWNFVSLMWGNNLVFSRFLVYEYMENGSLKEHLHGKSVRVPNCNSGLKFKL